MQVKLAAFEVEQWEREAFEQLSKQHEVRYTEAALDAANAHQFADAEALCPFIYSNLGAEVLGLFRNLRFITTRSTGVDHVDGAYCAAHRIVVSNVPGYGENSVAEHVFGLLLTVSHKLFEAIERTRRGDFSLAGLRGFELAGRTLGAVGTGGIGRQVIRIARGFGMPVVAFDVRPQPELAAELGFEYRPLPEVLAAADVVSLHVPGTPQTRHLLDYEQFAQMKDGAVLINTARGSVINVQALMAALASGRLRAAGLDVLPEEPTMREEAELLHRVIRREYNLETLLADHVLLRLRNVYITPHSAFCTEESVRQILDTTRANIAAFCAGRPQNLVFAPHAARA